MNRTFLDSATALLKQKSVPKVLLPHAVATAVTSRIRSTCDSFPSYTAPFEIWTGRKC